jgi:amino acid transporter
MPIGAYLTIGILITVIALMLFATALPKLRRYRLVIRPVAPRKKRRAKSVKKKRKSVWIKVI